MKKIISIITLFFLFIPYSNAINWKTYKSNEEKLNYKNNLDLKAKVIFRKFSLRKNPKKNSKIFWVLNFWDDLEILNFLENNWLKIKVISWKNENKIWYIKKKAINIENISIAKNAKIVEKKYFASDNQLDLNNYFTNLFSDTDIIEEPEYLTNTQESQNNYYDNYEEPEYNNYSNNSNIYDFTKSILDIYEEDERNWKYKEKKWIDQFNFFEYIFEWKHHNF
jgi:hypothetical protein